MKTVITLLATLMLVSCAKNGSDGQTVTGPQGPAGQTVIGPQGPAGNSGLEINSKTRCYKFQGGLAFDYVVTTFSNSDKFVQCSISNASFETQNSSFFKSTMNGAVNESCNITWDSDATPTAGFWTFGLVGNVKQAVYNDSGSAANGSGVTFAAANCATN